MANKLCLRRSLRSGLLSFFMNMHRPSASAARTNQPHNIDALDHAPDNAAAMASSSSCCSSSSMRASAHQYSAASFLPLHLAASRPCFPLASSTSSSACCSAADREDLPVGSYGDLQHIDDHDHINLLSHDGDHKLQARSHSCSKLHRRLMVPPFKSLLHHSHSHGRHSQICSSSSKIIVNIDHADEEPGINVSSRSAGVSSPSRVCEYTRSWSSPSLCHMKKAAGMISSFHGELQAAGSSSKGKRAPKGHVAVYVEGGKERYVVPIRYLSHAHFQELLERAESEFGFAQKGGLLLPCSRSELQHTLSRIRFDQSHPN